MKFLAISLLFLVGCSSEDTSKIVESHAWPDKIKQHNTGLKVEHSTDTVYATLNTKDPDTHGKYQLQFTTTVSSLSGDVKMIEFGGYLWKDDTWIPVSIYDRPFNPKEFDKWYDGDNGYIRAGKKYSDEDNWLSKGNKLNGSSTLFLLYFMGTNEQDKTVVGAKEVVGIQAMR